MKPLVLKIGGILLEDQQSVERFFSALKNIRQPCVLVHGGGVWIDERFKQKGVPIKKILGKRVTPFAYIDQVVEVLTGKVNRALQSAAQSAGLKPVGLTLSDSQSLELTQDIAELQAVGEVKPGRPDLIEFVFEQHGLPIFACVGMNAKGQWLNVNADDAAVALAIMLKADLILLSNVVGVLDDQSRLLENLNESKIHELIDRHVIIDGMQIKVLGALQAAVRLRHPVWIGSWDLVDQMAEKLFDLSIDPMACDSVASGNRAIELGVGTCIQP